MKPVLKAFFVVGCIFVGILAYLSFYLRHSLVEKIGLVEIWQLSPPLCLAHSGCSSYEIKVRSKSYGSAYIAQMPRVYRPNASLFLVWPRKLESKAYVIHTQSGEFLEVPGRLKDVDWCGSPLALYVQIDRGVLKYISRNGKIIEDFIGDSPETIATTIECRASI